MTTAALRCAWCEKEITKTDARTVINNAAYHDPCFEELMRELPTAPRPPKLDTD